MILALKCWSSNEDYNADFDFAFLTMTHGLVDLIRRRMALFESVHAEDDKVVEVRFWDYTPDYCSEADILAWAEDKYEDLPDSINELLNGAEVIELPEGFTFEDKNDDFRSECGSMEVNQCGVNWGVYPKHCSTKITTAQIGEEEIRRFLEGETKR